MNKAWNAMLIVLCGMVVVMSFLLTVYGMIYLVQAIGRLLSAWV